MADTHAYPVADYTADAGRHLVSNFRAADLAHAPAPGNDHPGSVSDMAA
jgi:hypothetical protein